MPVTRDITFRLSTSSEMATLLEDLSEDIGKSRGETIALALVMLRVAVDADHEGKRLVITDDDYEVDQEILIPGRPE